MGVIPPVAATRQRMKSIRRSCDQRHDFKGMGKNFAHRLRGGADLTDIAVVSNLLRRKNVFDEEHLVRLQAPRQLDRVHPA